MHVPMVSVGPRQYVKYGGAQGTESWAVRLYSRFDAHARHGCRVEYAKGGRAKILWSSRSSSAYCVSKVIHLVTVLSQDNFKCTLRIMEATEPD